MAGVKNADLADLLATTLEDLPKQEFEVEWDSQDYEFCRIMQKDSLQIDGGTSIVRNVMLDHTGNARYRRLYDTDTPTVGDTQVQITVPWTQLSTDYSWDKLEIKRNMNSAKGFVNMMKVRRIDGLWALAELIEDRGWKTPQNASDDLYPYGVPYYLNKLTSTQISAGTTSGFHGQTIVYQDASTGTTCAGIDASSVAKWQNYAAQYTSISNDFLAKARRAFIETNFQAPYFINDPAKLRSARKGCYCNHATLVELQELLDERDDNTTPKDGMGGVAARLYGTVLINGLPVRGIPQLNADTDNPFYCIDFRRFIPVVQDGYWMEETEPMYDKMQHTVFTIFVDGSHNNLCTSRRKTGFVLHN
jgi:hypothetical protein